MKNEKNRNEETKETKEMQQNFEKVKKDSSKLSKFAYLILGLVAGVILSIVLMFLMMPKMMLVVNESKYDTVEETVKHLESAIKANGWSSPAIRNLNKSMAKHGVEFDSPVRIVELCKAQYANEVLKTNPEVATLMPCAWGVFKKNGKVYISGMNMGLMGKIFGGNIAKVMGGNVAEDEHKMLETVIVK